MESHGSQQDVGKTSRQDQPRHPLDGHRLRPSPQVLAGVGAIEQIAGVIYRKAGESDLDAMFELWWEMQSSHTAYDALWYGPKPKEECRPICLERFRQFLADDSAIVLLAVLSDQPIGMLIGHIVGRPPVLTQIKVFAINNVVVTEAHRRKGVLRGMMDTVMAEMKAKGVEAIKFSVPSDNPARAAYERLGFACHELSMGKYLE